MTLDRVRAGAIVPTRVTISTRGAAALAAIVTVAMLGLGVSSAAAADVSGVITSVTKTTTAASYTLHKRVSLAMTWDAGKVDLKAGDTMSLVLDSSLGCDATPDMLAPDGQVVATAACAGGVITWTFTPWVEAHPIARHGGADFTVVTQAADDHVTVTWDGTTTVLPLSIGVPTGSGYAKWATSDHWRIRFGAPLKAGAITFTETLGACQVLDHVVWVKGSGTLDASTMIGTTTWDGDDRHTPILDIYVATTCVPADHTYRNGVVANGKSRSATAEAGAGAWGTGTSSTTSSSSTTSATSTTSSSSTTSTSSTSSSSSTSTSPSSSSSSSSSETSWTTTTPPTSTTSTSSTSTSSTSSTSAPTSSTTTHTSSGGASSSPPRTTSSGPTGGAPLPDTGSNTGPLSLLAVCLVLAGLAAVAGSRSRRTGGRYSR